MSFYVAWVITMLGVFAYIAPTVVALVREAPNTASIVVVNVFAGWTLIGWVGALALAVRSKGANPLYPVSTVAPGTRTLHVERLPR